MFNHVNFLPSQVYATERHAEFFYDDDPEQVALDAFGYDIPLNDIVEVYVGSPYIPENEDELNFMAGEGFDYLVKDIKLFAKYQYQESDDSVYEVRL